MSNEKKIDGVSFNKLAVQGMKEKDFIAEYMHEKHADIWPGADKAARLKDAYAKLTETPATGTLTPAEPPVIDVAHK